MVHCLSAAKMRMQWVHMWTVVHTPCLQRQLRLKVGFGMCDTASLLGKSFSAANRQWAEALTHCYSTKRIKKPALAQLKDSEDVTLTVCRHCICFLCPSLEERFWSLCVNINKTLLTQSCENALCLSSSYAPHGLGYSGTWVLFQSSPLTHSVALSASVKLFMPSFPMGHPRRW